MESTIDKLIEAKETLIKQHKETYEAALTPVLDDLNTMAKAIADAEKEIGAVIEAQVAAGRRDKPFGALSFETGGHKITQTVPKKVEWNQPGIADVYDRIKAHGDNPAQYIKLKFTVDERKFDAWPDQIKQIFAPARTVTPGKPTIKIKPLKKDGE